MVLSFRNIDFLKGWPVELMASNPKKCLFHFFRYKNSLLYLFIYLIDTPRLNAYFPTKSHIHPKKDKGGTPKIKEVHLISV